MEEKMSESLEDLLGFLDQSQTEVEQNAFHTLNKQDKANGLFQRGLAEIAGLSFELESASFIAAGFSEEAVSLLQDDSNKPSFQALNQLVAFLDAVAGWHKKLEDICIIMQDSIDSYGQADEEFHKLENSIAEHRELLDHLIRKT